MADNKHKAGDKSATITEAAPPENSTALAVTQQAALANTGKDGFVEIILDRPSVKFEPWLQRREGDNSGKEYYLPNGPIVQGKLIGAVELGQRADEETGELRPQLAYVIESEIHTKGFDAQGEPVDIAPGGQHLLWPTARLNQAIQMAAGISPVAAAEDPEFCLRIKLVPISREPMKKPGPDGKPRKLWNIKPYVDPKLVKRSQASSMPIGLIKQGRAAADRQLQAGVNSTTSS